MANDQKTTTETATDSAEAADSIEAIEASADDNGREHDESRNGTPELVATASEAAPEHSVADEPPVAEPVAPATGERPAPSEPAPASEAPAAEASAAVGEEASPSATSTAAAAGGAEAERKRPRLNPIGADQARPIPNLTGAASPPPESPAAPSPAPPVPAPAAFTAGAPSSEPSATLSDPGAPSEARSEATDETQPQTAAAPAPVSPRRAPAAPVEVPRDTELDADLEAEIAAAMSLAEQAETAAAAEAGKLAAEAAEAQAATGEEASGEEAVVAPLSEEDLTPGTRVKATIQSIHADNVFVDLGIRLNGVVSKRQFQSNRPAAVGQIIQVVVDKVDLDEGLVQCSLPKGVRKVSGNWDQLAVGQVVDCYVNKTNKGGLDVAVSGLRGFLPASQIDLRFVEDTEGYVGQKLRVKVTEVNPKKRNLVVSRRAILEEERKEAEQHVWHTLEKGQTVTGTVKTIKPYGAFVDVGGADGFLHVGEISWNRINDPSEVLEVGQQVEVQILKLDPEAKKISLGMKQLQKNPWSTAAANYPEGARVHGKVTRTTEFGAFVELEEGVEGLVHISELDHTRVRKVTDVLTVGQEVDVQVLDVDGKRRRISLSYKALKDKPEAAKDEDLSPGGEQPYVRKRKEPLKGGTGSEAGGGLFGNPTDFG